MANVTETVKQSLLGAIQPAALTSDARATFLANSQQGEDGELYMDQNAFISAIAPPDEDYVS
jgi:hypothetical protein